MNNRIEGMATVYIDGKKKWAGEAFTYTTRTIRREDSSGRSGPAGFVEIPLMSKLNVELIDTPENPIDDVNDVTDATIVFERRGGEIAWTYLNAWKDGDPVEANENGRATVEFHSKFPPKKTKG